jgi:hypothetical protein
MAYQASSSTQRRTGQEHVRPADDIPQRPRQVFNSPHTSLGAVGHWVYLAGVMAPLLIGEFIPDPAKRWRAARIASIVTALTYEGLYTVREAKRREVREAKLAQCRSRQPD